jgi:hypothetical protein
VEHGRAVTGEFAAMQVHGGRKLRATLKAAGADMSELSDLHQRVAQLVANAARPPMRSGKLARTQKGRRRRTSAIVTAGSDAVPYALPIHWGWPSRGIAPNTWLTNAAHATEPRWAALYEDELVRIVESVKTGD